MLAGLNSSMNGAIFKTGSGLPASYTPLRQAWPREEGHWQVVTLKSKPRHCCTVKERVQATWIALGDDVTAGIAHAYAVPAVPHIHLDGMAVALPSRSS